MLGILLLGQAAGKAKVKSQKPKDHGLEGAGWLTGKHCSLS